MDSLLAVDSTLVAGVPAGPWSLTVRTENDLPVNSDRYYTNGVSLSFAHCADEQTSLWPWVLRLPGLGRSGLLANGYDVGQVMVTPAAHRVVGRLGTRV